MVPSSGKSISAVFLSIALAGAVLLPTKVSAWNKAATLASEVGGGSMVNTDGDERLRRVTVAEEIDRGQLENLQRWVAEGHEEWCKDARLVAAQEMQRLAPDFSGEVVELGLTRDDASDAKESGASLKTFQWVPADGRAVYQVTVARFDWLLPIAEEAESIIWVPTRAEIWISEPDLSLERAKLSGVPGDAWPRSQERDA